MVSTFLLALLLESNTSFRGFFPDDFEVEIYKPDTVEVFEKAGGDSENDIGIKLELELFREGSFKVVPISTPLCTGDHIAFRFSSNESGFATVFAPVDNKKWKIIWPFYEWESHEFENGKSVRIPQEPNRGLSVLGAPALEPLLMFSSSPYSEKANQIINQLIGKDYKSQGIVPVKVFRDIGTEEAYTVGNTEFLVAVLLNHVEC